MAVQNKDLSEWMENKTLPECMMYMLKNEILCDVTFLVGEDCKPIKAHRYMLCSRSPVFHTMFQGSMPETNTINVPDIDRNTFDLVLKYIYSDEIEITKENVRDILYAAEKYILSRVKQKCSDLLKTTARSSDAVVALSTATQFHLEVLQRESLQFIESNTSACLASVHANNLSKECVEIIIQSDYLSSTETDICKFFLAWTDKCIEAAHLERNPENIRSVVGNLLYLIRFPLVEKKYFSQCVSHTGILTLPEIVNVFRSHYGEKSDLFVEKTRVPLSKRVTNTFTRHAARRSGWTASGVDSLGFESDKNIRINGVIIFGPTAEISSTLRSFEFEILNEKNISVYSSSLNLPLEATPSKKYTFGPVLIEANKSHTLLLKDIKVKTYYGVECMTSFTANSATVTVKNSTMCTTGTNTEQGQFAGILFIS
ncbi:speckle-type POZ protein [Mytilus galloprovincialis]|uniref:Speckle-type POZ protein n=1 Tax=Mytilus galloprovincialis TaxID=29158 RepID=A0A8B6E9S6_MYTGA|nr:speckle-type POZ protein [Mytilus galloprovincialis]